MLKIYLILAICGFVAAGGFYVNNLTNRLASLSEANAQLTQVAETNDATIKQMTKDAEELNSRLATLSKELQAAESYKDDLQKKLREHDLQQLSIDKPKIIEKRINDATAKVFRDFEQLTTD